MVQDSKVIWELIQKSGGAHPDPDAADVLADYFEEQGKHVQAQTWRDGAENIRLKKNPRRVQIISSYGNYLKDGQYGFVIGVTRKGGIFQQDDKDDPSTPGEVSYLVAKTKDARGGALWFSSYGVRFTKKRASYKRRRVY